MKCAACGTENKEAALFCKACGAGVVQATVSSGAAEAPPVGVVCRKCGHTNRIGLKFCGACGERLVSDGAHVAPPVPPPRQARPAAEPVGSTSAATATRQSATPGSKPAALARGSKLVTARAATPRNKVMFASIGLVIAVAGAAGYFWLSARKSEAPLVPVAAPRTAVPSADGSASQAVLPQAQAGASAAAAAVASPTDAPAPARDALPATAAIVPTLPLPARPPSTVTPPPPAIQTPQQASPEQSARVPEPTPQRVAPSKPPVSREPPREPRAQAPVPEQRPPTAPAAPPQSRATPPQDAAPPRQTEGDWYARLREELSRCKSAGNFLSRTLCEEKSKILLCGAGNHWGQVPECVQTNDRRPDSN